MRLRWLILPALFMAFPAEAVDHKFTVLSVNRIDTKPWQARVLGDMSEVVWVRVEYRRDSVPVDTLGFLLPTAKPSNAPEATYAGFIARLLKKRIRGLLDHDVKQTDRTPPLGGTYGNWVGLSTTLTR